MKWTEEKISLLIQLFRDQRVLWDPTNEHYNNREKKNAAWSQLSTRLDSTQDVLQKKMRKLIMLFDQEVDKRKSKSQNQSHGGYQEWCFYKPLLFLKNRNVIIKSFVEFGNADENVLEKARIWDWVLLVASLLTVFYWHLTKQQGDWELIQEPDHIQEDWGLLPDPDLAPTQSKGQLSFNLDKFPEKEEDVCSVDLIEKREDPRSNRFPSLYATVNYAQAMLLVKDTNVSTRNTKPHSAISTCMLSNYWDLVSGEATSLRTTLNSTAFSTMELMLFQENTSASILPRRQNRTTDTLANLTDKLKNKNPNGK